MPNKTSHISSLSFPQKLLYYILYGFVYLNSLLPLRVLYVFSDLLYLLIYHVIGYRKKLVRKHLHDSFPEKDEQELRKIEHRFYHWFGDYIVETIKMASISKEQMKRRVNFRNTEYLQKLLNDGRDVVLYLGHYCNWEWMTSINLHAHPVQTWCVYHPLESPAFNAVMLKVRSTMGMKNVAMANILRHVIKERKEGRRCVIGFISDQVPLYPATQYWTEFLNHKGTLVITGTEQIIRRFDYACTYLDISCPRRGYYDIDIVPMTEKASEHGEWQITEMYFRLFEKSICRQPEYWLWTHNRWKRTVEGLMEWRELQKKKNS